MTENTTTSPGDTRAALAPVSGSDYLEKVLERLPGSFRALFAGGITFESVIAYHRGWAAWHRSASVLAVKYRCQEDCPEHDAKAIFHDAMADVLKPNRQAEGRGSTTPTNTDHAQES